MKAGLAASVVVSTALAADTVSITIMEAIDNLVIVLIPGAMDAGMDEALLWLSIAAGFAVAFPFAWLCEPLHDRARQGARGRAPVPLIEGVPAAQLIFLATHG